jgi:hypothetical protein
VSRDTQGTRRSQRCVVYRAVTVYGRSFQIVQLHRWFVTPYDGPYNPTVQARWFGLFRVRSPLLAESLLFSIPAGTEMVHFPALPSHRLCIQRWILRDEPKGVSPFGDPRVKAHLQLTGAYRSLSRPSSTSGAKAFTVHP